MAPVPGPNGAQNAPFEPYPVPQRTLDLKREDVYCRIRLELHGESGTQTTLTRKTFEQTIKHSLAKTHGVVGGAIVMEHVVPFTNENEDDDFDGCGGRQSNGTIGTELVMTDTHSTSKSTSKAGHGIIKLHVSDFQTLATSLTLLSETSESVSCGARVVSKGTDLVALGFDGRELRKKVVREALGQPHEP